MNVILDLFLWEAWRGPVKMMEIGVEQIRLVMVSCGSLWPTQVLLSSSCHLCSNSASLAKKYTFLNSYWLWWSRFPIQWTSDTNWHHFWLYCNLWMQYWFHSCGQHGAHLSSNWRMEWNRPNLWWYAVANQTLISPVPYKLYLSYQMLIVVIWKTQSMDKCLWVVLLLDHWLCMNVTQVPIWWETWRGCAKTMKSGVEQFLPVTVRCNEQHVIHLLITVFLHQLWTVDCWKIHPMDK